MKLWDEINNEYFEWIYNLVCANRYSKQISYRKLLMYLHSTEFIFSIPRDGNRADDGLALRYRFAYDYADAHDTEIENAEEYIDGPCSVLEMMVALSIRCEEFMDDPSIGDRTGQWFWGMIVNLGLGSMTDSHFDKERVVDAVNRFLNREYEPNGEGGLFTLRKPCRDLRSVEIWYQMCWYLDERFY